MTGDPDLTTASESYNTLLQPSEMKDMVSGQPLLDHKLFWLDAGVNGVKDLITPDWMQNSEESSLTDWMRSFLWSAGLSRLGFDPKPLA